MPDYDFLYKALFGAIIGALVTRAFTRNREKITLTFELHKEYNSPQMNSHRRSADKLAKDFPATLYSELEKSSTDELTSIFLVLQFFQRLSSSVEYNLVKKKLVLKLFAEPFYFWYYISYQRNLVPLKWNSSEQMAFLAKWFARNLDSGTHMRLKSEFSVKLAERMTKN